MFVCGRMLVWRATHTGFVVCCWQASVGIHTTHTPSHPVTPGVILPITPTHRDVSTHMVQGGHHPNAWTRGGDWLVLLSSAVVAVAGEVYRVQDWELATHSAPWEPRVHARTRPEDPATHRVTPAMLGRGGDCGRPLLFFASRTARGWEMWIT